MDTALDIFVLAGNEARQGKASVRKTMTQSAANTLLWTLFC